MSITIDVSGKVAIVTMSTGGIGLAVAKRLAAAEAEAVILNGRNEERGRQDCATLARHCLCEPKHSCLRSRVMRATENATATLCGDRRQARNRTTVFRTHDRDYGLAHVKRTTQRYIGYGNIVVGVISIMRKG